MHWQLSSFATLTNAQLYAILQARVAVFVVEQRCCYQDLDGYDAAAEHLIGWIDDEVGAYLRILGPNTKFAEPSLGRIITTQCCRGSGVGRELVARGLAHLSATCPGMAVRIGAQAHLEKFYGSFGFTRASDVYDEDGIPHIEMLRPPGVTA